MKKVTDVSEIKVGDKIRILRKPNSWGSYLNDNCPLHLDFPHDLVVKKIEKSPMQYLSMTCGSYGWNLGSIVNAGCEIVEENLTMLPEKWFIVGGTEEFQKFMKTQSTFWSGNGDKTGYYFHKPSKSWSASKIKDLKELDYIEISFNDYIRLTKNNSNNNQKSETMSTKTDKINAYINAENEIVVTKNGNQTLKVPVIKETLTTRVIKLQSITFDRKDKAQENPIVTTVEREVSISVISDENGYIYAGYSVKNPTDENVSPEIGKTIARNRAINPKTNLTHNENVSVGLISKQVLKGIAGQIFERMTKGSVKLKGVK